jgi:hypothetical protein
MYILKPANRKATSFVGLCFTRLMVHFLFEAPPQVAYYLDDFSPGICPHSVLRSRKQEKLVCLRSFLRNFLYSGGLAALLTTDAAYNVEL